MANTATPAPADAKTDESAKATAKGNAPKIEGLKEGWYHLEVKETSPRACITFGGLAFHRVTYKPRTVDEGNETIYDIEVKGQDLYLTDFELNNLRAAMGRKILRVVSDRSGRSQIHRIDSDRYRRRPQDKPLESFLILRPTDEPSDPQQDTESVI